MGLVGAGASLPSCREEAAHAGLHYESSSRGWGTGSFPEAGDVRMLEPHRSFEVHLPPLHCFLWDPPVRGDGQLQMSRNGALSEP